MEILFFSPYFYPYISGLTTYPYKILTHLSKKHKITVLTFPYQKELTINNQQLTIKYLPYFFRFSNGFISPPSIFYFYYYAKKSDLIILNQPNFEGLFLAIIGKILHKKIVSILHCQVFLDSGFFNQIINSFLNLSVFIQLWLSNNIIAYTEDYFKSLKISRFFLKKTRFVLPPIEFLKINQKKLKEFDRLKTDKIWLGYAGRIASEKGLEYLVQSINQLYAKNKVELVFAGPYGKDVSGEDKYYKRIINLLETNVVKHHFFGNLSDGDLSAFYKAIDLLVLPSINQTEAFGMVQAEAMLTGTPVIASNLPGVRVPIRLTKMGEIVKPKNPQQISKAIIKILKNKNKFSNNFLINKAKKIFDINKTYQFYDNLVCQSHPNLTEAVK